MTTKDPAISDAMRLTLERLLRYGWRGGYDQTVVIAERGQTQRVLMAHVDQFGSTTCRSVPVIWADSLSSGDAQGSREKQE